MRQARPWTKEEDVLLRDAVSRQEGEATINWHEVASFIEGRNNKECRKRWVYALEPSINKGAWEPAEDDLLRKGVQLHGTKWADVARVVGSRHPDQCSKRWHEVLKPNINRDRWSLMEDTTLRNAVLAHGRKWIEIVERYFPERTPIATRNRYFQLQKRDAESADPANPESADGASTDEMSWAAQQSPQFSSSEFTNPPTQPPAEFFSHAYPNLPMAIPGSSIDMAMHQQMSMAQTAGMPAANMPAYYPQPTFIPTAPMPGFEADLDGANFQFPHPGHH